MNRLAPLIIFSYNRYDEIVSTISSLKENYLANKTDVYVFSDQGKTLENCKDVAKIREYLNSISFGFKSVTVIKREENYGLARNIIEGVTEVIGRHGKVIVLEDDLITSKNFLCYMNSALDYYDPIDSVFSISGYSGNLSSLKSQKFDSYLSYRPSSWGWATWKERWGNIDWDVEDFEEFIKNKKEVKKFNRGGIDMTRMLRHQQEGKNNSWAIRWAYAMYKQDRFCVYPRVSKIQNIGFGDNSTHCTGINIYKTILDIDNKNKFIFTDEKKPDHLISREFRYQYSYRNKFIKRIVGWFKELKKSRFSLTSNQ